MIVRSSPVLVRSFFLAEDSSLADPQSSFGEIAITDRESELLGLAQARKEPEFLVVAVSRPELGIPPV